MYHLALEQKTRGAPRGWFIDLGNDLICGSLHAQRNESCDGN